MTTPFASTALNGRAQGRAGSLGQQLVDTLTDRIKQGDLKTGDRLPTEVELIEQYGVSRTVVREAIARLKADGLVDTRHGIGTFVLDPSQHVRIATDPQEVQTIKEVLQMLEFRLCIEPETAALAAQRRSAADLETIRTALDEVTQHRIKGEDSTAADFAFHQSIARASNNQFFLRTLEFLGMRAIPRTQVRTHHYQALPRQQYLEVVNQQHEAIYTAIAAGDAEKARTAMHTHLSASLDRLRQAIAAEK